MRKLGFYVSGLGYGHLTRSMAVIRELIKHSNIHVTLRCHSTHIQMAAAEFSDKRDSVKIQHFDRGFSVYFDDLTGKVNMGETLSSVDSWLNTLETGAKLETDICRESGYDLILSDIAPEAFFAAEQAGIPGIGVSNFTWFEFMREFIGLERSEPLKWMYQKASAFLEYPLSTGDNLPVSERVPIGLVSRPLSSERIRHIRDKYKRPGRLLVFLSVGGALSLKNAALPPEVDYLYTRGIELPSGDNTFKVPPDAADTHNYLAACDCVVTKCGWSTAAEALIAQKPLYLMRTGEGGIEERHMLNELSFLCISRLIESGNGVKLDKGLFDDIYSMQNAYGKIPTRYTNQVSEIASRILSYLR